MSSYDEEIKTLLNKIDAGSQEAAQQFVEKFGKSVLRAVRRRLHRKLRTHFDSDDFLQDVLATYLCNPDRRMLFADTDELIRYLTGIARNKVVNKARERLMQKRRNINRQYSLDGSAKWAAEYVLTEDPTPSQTLQNEEQWQEIGKSLTPKGRKILDLLRNGHTQAEITELLNLRNPKTIYRIVQRLKICES